MDTDELKELLTKIFELPEVERFSQAVAGILAYLKSEQDKRIELTEAMNDLKNVLYGSKTEIGVHHQLAAIQKRSDRNGKLTQGVLVGLILLVIEEGAKLLMAHIK